MKEQIQSIISCVREYYDGIEVDWSIIHNAGLTCDATELPHHVSTGNELYEIFEWLERFLKTLEIAPVVITISRSSSDDYCPQEQVEYIQQSVLSVLRRVYGKIDIKCFYEQDQETTL